MTFIDCEISEKNIEIFNEKKIFYVNNDYEVITTGLFCGSYYKDTIYSPDETVHLLIENIKNKNNFNDVIRNIVGPCYLIIKFINFNKYIIVPSHSSCGFLYTNDNNKIFINNIEKNFYQKLHSNYKLNEFSIYNAIYSHHSLLRAPFDGLFLNTFRCPPGFYLKIENFKIKDLESSILRNINELKFDNQEKKLDKAFKAVSLLYKKYLPNYQKNFCLLMSGGIDSSLLLSYFYKLNKNINLKYYSFNKSNEEKLAISISNFFNLKLNFEKKQSINLQILKKYASQGLSMFINPNHFQYTSINNGNNNYYARGQNGDTLFHVDHFGPDNRVGGLARLIKSITTVKFRIYHYIPFFKKSKYLFFWPFLIKTNQINFEELVKSSLFSTSEHNIPYDNSSVSKDEKIIEFRNDYYWKKIYNSFNKNYPETGWQTNQNPLLTNHLNRVSRWIRTVTNFSQQFVNRDSIEKRYSIVPYSEGPISSILLIWKLEPKDYFKIKNFSINYFKKNSGISYSKLRRKSVGFYNYTKQFVSIFFKSKKRNKNFIAQKNHNKLNDIFHLKQEDKTYFLSLFENKFIREEIIKIFEIIDSFDKFKKSGLNINQLCNFLNILYFSINNFKK